jgi:ketosteroid isomerase-like protein
MSSFPPGFTLHTHIENGAAKMRRKRMIEQGTAGRLDFTALRQAIERKDPDALLSFYADDAELRVENAALSNGGAFELKGRARIERYLRAVCDQEVGNAVKGEAVFGRKSVAFVETCRYSEGATIYVHTALEVEGGLILRQVDVVEHPEIDPRGRVGAERDHTRRKREEGPER